MRITVRYRILKATMNIPPRSRKQISTPRAILETYGKVIAPNVIINQIPYHSEPIWEYHNQDINAIIGSSMGGSALSYGKQSRHLCLVIYNQHYPTAVSYKQIPATLPINNSAFIELFWVPKIDIIKAKDNLNYLAQHSNPKTDWYHHQRGAAKFPLTFSNKKQLFLQELSYRANKSL
jgi:hypothetical protein